VIIWTRITADSLGETNVKWQVAQDLEFKKIVKKGKVITNADQDYTIKVDVTGLKENSYYYYRFQLGGFDSPVGRTKTTPAKAAESVKLGVVSCSNYEAGYFNAYATLADKDLDAVLHLGDYIYEYQPDHYGDKTLPRKHQPAKEIITLDEYRQRYSQYRQDADLQRVHQLHPFITIWDDHEITNNAHVTGAENHNDGEGDFEARKAAARKAYYEWMPIRESEKLYRKISFGRIADVLMLDERLEGRSQQADSIQAKEYYNEQRTMLGEEQLNWLVDKMKNSKARWKIIGNQVIFADVNIAPISGENRPKNMDAWDGYPIEKANLIDAITKNQIKDIVFVTGDTHCSWAFEVPTNVSQYDPRTSSNTIAVEFGTPGITSANLDEYRPMNEVLDTEQKMRQANRHLKYVDLHSQGYFILTMTQFDCTADYYYIDRINSPSKNERKAKSYTVRRGKSQVLGR
jgi:alkaline phosphatase D